MHEQQYHIKYTRNGFFHQCFTKKKFSAAKKCRMFNIHYNKSGASSLLLPSSQLEGKPFFDVRSLLYVNLFSHALKSLNLASCCAARM